MNDDMELIERFRSAIADKKTKGFADPLTQSGATALLDRLTALSASLNLHFVRSNDRIEISRSKKKIKIVAENDGFTWEEGEGIVLEAGSWVGRTSKAPFFPTGLVRLLVEDLGLPEPFAPTLATLPMDAHSGDLPSPNEKPAPEPAVGDLPRELAPPAPEPPAPAPKAEAPKPAPKKAEGKGSKSAGGPPGSQSKELKGFW